MAVSRPIDNTAWRKSSYSGATTQNCVEVGNSLGVVLVRDSKSSATPALRFDGDAWAEFLSRL
ncbi:MAG: DUF397 domain-containing protein [Mycobacterium sp.]